MSKDGEQLFKNTSFKSIIAARDLQFDPPLGFHKALYISTTHKSHLGRMS